jgi:hypothetical protein
VIRSLTSSFAPFPPAAKPTSVVVLAASGDPDLFDYDSRFESTHRPCDLLWDPGDPAMPCSGSPITTPRQTRSRPSTALFPIQYHGDRLTLLRGPGAAAAFGPGDRTAPST